MRSQAEDSESTQRAVAALIDDRPLVTVVAASLVAAGHAKLSAMDHTVTVLERAFQLAESGSCASVADIKKRLSAEGYAVAQLTGRTLTKQLNALINAERGALRC